MEKYANGLVKFSTALMIFTLSVSLFIGFLNDFIIPALITSSRMISQVNCYSFHSFANEAFKWALLAAALIFFLGQTSKKKQPTTDEQV